MRWVFGKSENHVGAAFRVFEISAADKDNERSPRFDFEDIRRRFFVICGVCRKGDNGRSVFYKGYRPVFEFACGVGFAVDIRNFLQFQRTFVPDGEIGAPSDEIKVVFILYFFGDFFYFVPARYPKPFREVFPKFRRRFSALRFR